MTGRHFQGKTALITGASRGIGSAIAQALAAEGANVVLAGRNQASLSQVAKDLRRYKVDALPVACDVRDPLEIERMIGTVKRRFRRIDILVNNAGVAHPNLSVAELPAETWMDVIATNLTGMFLVTQAALPMMRRGGSIVNNLSIAARQVFPGLSAYNAAKNGALGLTNTLREELRPRGIRVIALLPGATDTEIWNAFWPDAPRKKMMSPKTVAEAVVNALALPDESTVEELTILPSAGTL